MCSESLSFDLPQCIVEMWPSSPSLSSLSSLPLPFSRIYIRNYDYYSFRLEAGIAYTLCHWLTSGCTVTLIGAGFVGSDLQTHRLDTADLVLHDLLWSFWRAIQHEYAESQRVDLVSKSVKQYEEKEGELVVLRQLFSNFHNRGGFESAVWKYFWLLFGINK